MVDLRSANVFSKDGAPPVTPPRGGSQQSSPAFQRIASPSRRGEVSLEGNQGSRDKDTTSAPLLPDRRPSGGLLVGSHEDVGNGIPGASSTSGKRPLPPLPPKPKTISGSNRHLDQQPKESVQTINLQAPLPRSAAQQIDGTKDTETSSTTEKEYQSMDDLLRNESYTAPTPARSNPPATSSTTPLAHQPSSTATTSTSSPHRNPLLHRSKPMMPARSSPSGNETCAGCGKIVYFAEGVRLAFHSSRSFPLPHPQMLQGIG